MVFLLTLLLACHGTSGTTSADDTTSTDTTSADDTTSTDDTTGDDTDRGPGPGWVRVDASHPVDDDSVDVAVAPNGTIWVAWVSTGAQGADLWLSHSADGGATFSPPVQVDDDTTSPISAMGRRPYLDADDDRVAVALNDTNEANAGKTFVYVGAASGGTFQRTTLGEDVPQTFADWAKPAFSPSGDLAVAWQGYDPTGFLLVAKESDGWKAARANTGAPGLPCECCPLDFRYEPGGEALIAFRDNDSDQRDHWLARAPSGTFSSFSQLSRTEGELRSCPMQGPRLAITSGGTLLATWANASGDLKTMLARSTDDGATWSDAIAVTNDSWTSNPAITLDRDGKVWVAVHTTGATGLVSSGDEGATFSAPTALVSPDGALASAQLDSGGGATVAAGRTSAGAVWVYRIE